MVARYAHLQERVSQLVAERFALELQVAERDRRISELEEELKFYLRGVKQLDDYTNHLNDIVQGLREKVNAD